MADGIAEITGDIVNNMPDVDDFVVNNTENDANGNNTEPVADKIVTSVSDTDNLIDVDGTVFNPEVHISRGGSPVKTKNGKFRKKRKQKINTTSELNTNQAPDLTSQGYEITAKAAAELLITLGVQIGGDEWYPIVSEEHGIDEKKNLEYSFKNYFEAKGIDDFPPGIALTVAIIGYGLPRLRMPKTKTRLSTATKWVFAKIKGWRK